AGREAAFAGHALAKISECCNEVARSSSTTLKGPLMTIVTSTQSSSFYTLVLGITCAAGGCMFDDPVEPSDHLEITEQTLEPSTAPYMFPSRGLEPGHY